MHMHKYAKPSCANMYVHVCMHVHMYVHGLGYTCMRMCRTVSQSARSTARLAWSRADLEGL